MNWLRIAGQKLTLVQLEGFLIPVTAGHPKLLKLNISFHGPWFCQILKINIKTMFWREGVNIYLFESIVSHIVDNDTHGVGEGVQISPGQNRHNI